MQNFNFTPVVCKNSVFKKLPLVFMYVSHSKEVHIHLYEGMIDLGFDSNSKVNFMCDKKNRKIFMFTHKEYGQSITRLNDDHFSIKCPIEFRELNLKPLPPTKKGKNSSGKYLLGETMEISGFTGVMIDISQFDMTTDSEETI